MNNQQKQLNEIFEGNQTAQTQDKILNAILDLSQPLTEKTLVDFFDFINLENVKAMKGSGTLNGIFYAVSMRARENKPVKVSQATKRLFIKQMENAFENCRMSGKMQGITAFSTLKFCNHNCYKFQNVQGSICEHCYVNLYTQSIVGFLKNTLAICFVEFKTADFKNMFVTVKNAKSFVRFEAMGDLINEIQASNYIKLAKAQSRIKFALWTKNFDILNKALEANPAPKNLNLILSYLKISQNGEDFTQSLTDKVKAENVKAFIVAKDEKTAGKILESNPNASQCFAKSCATCGKCYTKNDSKLIVEVLK